MSTSISESIPTQMSSMLGEDIEGPPKEHSTTGSPADVNSTEDTDDSDEESSKGKTNISTIPSYETEFLPSEVLSRAPSGRDIYIEKLFPLNYGYPLWFPQPDRNLQLEYRRKGVSIGDVGVIRSNGAFDFLFNIWLPAHHPINPHNLPDDFDSVPRPHLSTTFQTSFNPGASTISNLNIISHLDSDAGSEISIACKDVDKGAIIAIPDGASEEDLRTEWDLKEFISKNALKWYRYARSCGLELDRHSLYLVTGCMKSKTWGIATFGNAVRERDSILLIGKSSNIIGTPYMWKQSGEATTFRIGPTLDPGITTGNEPPADTENQCLFLRGFKIALSNELWNSVLDRPEILAATNNKKRSFSPDESSRPQSSKRSRNDGNASEGQSSAFKYSSNDISITSFPVHNNTFHPLDAINDVLLSQIPGACIAVTHDKMWTELSDYTVEQLHETIRDRYVISYCKGS
ncbi:hypothetical protein BDQ17DRAFT_845341 [Cyathus striatus]|nr:hypothetical protein BDQ17DRAFT_845341 [Cyathus striatus]